MIPSELSLRLKLSNYRGPPQGERGGEAQSLYSIASLEADRGNLESALSLIQESLNIVEDLRGKISDPELRQTYFSTVQSYYQFAIELLMELHRQNPSRGYDRQAFEISERSRARVLLELLAEANAKIKEGVDPQLLTREQSLSGQLSDLEKQRLDLFNDPKSTPARKTEIVEKYQTLLEQYQDLQNEIRQKSPRYASLKYPTPLSLEQIQKQFLDEDTVLLQYSLGEKASYLWVVTREDMTAYSLPPRAEIEERAEIFLEQINRNNPETLAEVEPLLSQIILAPARDQLTQKRLVIVADGVLQYVPFATLSLSEDRQPLVTRYEIVNLPSSSSLATLRPELQARKPAPKTLAILANPVFSKDDRRVIPDQNSASRSSTDLGTLALNRAVPNFGWEKFSPLPGTLVEAQNILSLVANDSQTIAYFDFSANLSTALDRRLRQYRIVHFATHGILNTASPELSGIVLSLVDEKGNNINGFLRLNDIFNLQLPADLVVLSACETGLGKNIKGEGLIGLTRGFMYAGAPRLLVSLWKVDDRATAEMMTRFYRLMFAKKLTPARALREAQLEMRQETEWRSPYYWSAFVLQGEWR